jgi:hypothetical protein
MPPLLDLIGSYLSHHDIVMHYLLHENGKPTRLMMATDNKTSCHYLLKPPLLGKDLTTDRPIFATAGTPP